MPLKIAMIGAGSVLMLIVLSAIPVQARQSAVSGQRLYVHSGQKSRFTADGDLLQVYDVSRPARPILLGRTAAPGQAGIAIEGHYVYITSSQTISMSEGDYATGETLYIFDVKNPARPTLKRRIALFPHAPGSLDTSVMTLGHTAITVHSAPHQLRVFDIKHPLQPRLQGSIEIKWDCDSAAASGRYVYIADGAALHVYDILHPDHPAQQGSVGLNKAGDAVSDCLIAVAGASAYAVYHAYSSRLPSSSYSAGHPLPNADYSTSLLQVFAIHDPAHPVRKGFVKVGNQPNSIKVCGDYVYLTTYGVANSGTGEITGGDTLQIIDAHRPDRPVLKGSVKTGKFACVVAAFRNYVYVSCENHALQVYDVTNPDKPVLTSAAPPKIPRAAPRRPRPRRKASLQESGPRFKKLSMQFLTHAKEIFHAA